MTLIGTNPIIFAKYINILTKKSNTKSIMENIILNKIIIFRRKILF
jgi:hypothetical protein